MSIGLNRCVVATLLCINTNSILSKTPHCFWSYNVALLFEMSDISRQTVKARPWLPTLRSLDNCLFSQRYHSFKVQCQTKRTKSTPWSGRSLWSVPRPQQSRKCQNSLSRLTFLSGRTSILQCRETEIRKQVT